MTRQLIIPMRRSDNAFVRPGGSGSAVQCMCSCCNDEKYGAWQWNEDLGCQGAGDPVAFDIHLWIGESDWHPEVILVLVVYDLIN